MDQRLHHAAQLLGQVGTDQIRLDDADDSTHSGFSSWLSAFGALGLRLSADSAES
jgi:hypothetical protein